VSIIPSLLALQTYAAVVGIEDPGTSAEAAITIEPSEHGFVEARHFETVVRGRPWVPHKRVATIARGTRLAVRGMVESGDREGCRGKPWYAVLPFGYVCSEHVRPTSDPPAPGRALPVAAGRRLPFSYATVRQDGVLMYDSPEAVEAGTPSRELTKSMTLVTTRSLEIDGSSYVQTSTGGLVPREGISWMGDGSAWQGVELDIEDPQPGPLFAWVRTDGAAVRSAPDRSATKVDTVQRRQRVPILESEIESHHPLWWRIGDGRWVEADALNEVHIKAPPSGALEAARTEATGNDQWIDVDVGEQVLVAYRGHHPVYATLVSSGRASPTPLGNYPVWAKVASMDMANQDYEDKPYMVQGVPWVLLFQGHNALHGAYWHDRFGNRKSHGCVNLAPLDARWMFEWTGPTMPAGWTGYLPSDLGKSPVVHVRDSSKPEGATFTQERPTGPPDREQERKKAEAAEQRRALAATREAELEDPIGAQLDVD
jgi:lipoprotein-anchoring transpeptidase ErfK/SrfK